MRYVRYITSLCLLALGVSTLSAQGLNTQASKDEWEEINFEFNQAVLVDGFPSLLRLADILKEHNDYKVKIEGHTDQIGGARYNERLGQRRADTVRDFLVKYGAGANQLSAASIGKRSPKIPSRERNARFMNRRVTLTVTDGTGKVISEGSIRDALAAMQAQTAAAAQKCCEDIMKRLDKLDEIADMLRKSTADNDALKKELDDLRKQHADLDAYVRGLPKPLTTTETAQIVDTRTAEQIERARMPRYSTINLNAGLDSDRNLTFTGRGRLFMPFKERSAVQLQGEYLYFRGRQEGQFDFGVVNRFLPRAQAGVFGSMKYVSLSPTSTRQLFDDVRLAPFYTPSTSAGGVRQLAADTGQANGSGLLGQASATLDYLFSRGRLGVFGAKGFLNEAVLGRTSLTTNLFNEYYIRTIDQIGLSTTVGLFGDVYLEGNIGYLKSRGYADRPGGTARFVFPMTDRFAFTVEGGMNETLLTRSNWGRVVAGVQFGNYQRPKDYMTEVNGVLHAVPADIPRVRYELLARRVRTGNGPPVADAGPDQIGVAPGTITLNGSGSFDPEGDPITFQWSQIAGPGVSISGQNTSTATFNAEQGQTYSFRLTVTDDKGASSIARVTISTARPNPVQIVRFVASPSNIRSGQSATLDWQVLNADTVTITQLGSVPANGSRSVNPTTTTSYVLTATNSSGSATATTTVVVEDNPRALITACQVTPTNIVAGETATLFYSTSNASTVNISSIGAVDPSGSRMVSPTATTTYTITAQGATGTPAATCTVTVQVTPGTAPQVIRFAAVPTSITSGGRSSLIWAVDNADTVTISNGVGTVNRTGTVDVTPTATTTYTLTATNKIGQTTATATVTVIPAAQNPTISACTATPASITSGATSSLAYTATNATAVTISGVSGTPTVSGPFTVNPTQTTTYTITAAGAQGTTAATCTVTVTVSSTPVPPAPSSVDIRFIPGPRVDTGVRDVAVTAVLTPNIPITSYSWVSLTPGGSVVSQSGASATLRAGVMPNDYQFQLTITAADGTQYSSVETLRYVPPAGSF